jgi:hypothetical protein
MSGRVVFHRMWAWCGLETMAGERLTKPILVRGSLSIATEPTPGKVARSVPVSFAMGGPITQEARVLRSPIPADARLVYRLAPPFPAAIVGQSDPLCQVVAAGPTVQLAPSSTWTPGPSWFVDEDQDKALVRDLLATALYDLRRVSTALQGGITTGGAGHLLERPTQRLELVLAVLEGRA